MPLACVGARTDSTTSYSYNARRGQLPRTRIGIVRRTRARHAVCAEGLHFSAFHFMFLYCPSSCMHNHFHMVLLISPCIPINSPLPQYILVRSYIAVFLSAGDITTYLATRQKAMAAYWKIRSFNSKTDEWEIYKEQLQFYMVANNFSDPTKKPSILLTVCGEQTFKLLCSLVPDGKLDGDDISYESLVVLLYAHYKKQQSVAVHRFHFDTRTCRKSESITDYIAESLP